MPRRTPVRLAFTNGFAPSQDFLGVVPDSLISGENLIIFGDGLPRTAKGLGTASASGSPRPAMNVKSTYGGVSVYGSVISFFNIIICAGSGAVTLTGSSIGSVSDNLAIQAGGVLVPAGVPAPGAPTVSLTPPTTGRNIGSYSAVLTAVRLLGPVTGESSRGAPSVPVSMINKKFRFTAWPATPSGCDVTRDKWGLYFPFRGFPTQGPWRHLIDIPMNTALPYDIDFLDGELGHLAPLDHDVPPAFKFCFSIDNVVVGVAAGGQLWPGVPLQPDSFPPDKVVMLARGEDVVSCRSSGGSGRIALACANSLHEVVASGDDTISPIIAYPRWPTTGFDGHSCWCFHNDTIYGITGNTPVMGTLDSAPSSDFANRVKTWFEDNGMNSSNTVVGDDPSTGMIVYAGGSNNLSIGYLGNGIWSTPIPLSGAPLTAVTVTRQLLIDIGGTNKIYEGGSGTTAYGIPAFWDGGNEFLKTLVRVRGASDTTLTLEPLTDLSLTPALGSFTSAAQHGIPKRLNIRNLTSFSVKFTLTGSRKTIHPLLCQVVQHKTTDYKR